jgi:hypothetical protein
MPDDERGRAEDEFSLLWVLFVQTKDAILRVRERDYARYGISNDRRAILYIIESSGGTATPVVIAHDFIRDCAPSPRRSDAWRETASWSGAGAPAGRRWRSA